MRRLFIGLLAVACAASLGLTAGAASAAPRSAPRTTPIWTSLSSSTVARTTSKGVGVNLSIYSFLHSNENNNRSLSVTLTRSTASGYQSYSWSFNLPTTENGWNPTTHKGFINTGSTTISPFGLVHLTFAENAKAHSPTCVTGKETIYPVSLSGIVYFNTHSTAWGTLGSTKTSYTFKATNTVTVDAGCSTKPPLPTCYNALDWGAGKYSTGSSSNFQGGSVGSSSGYVGATRFVTFTTPKNSGRSDYGSAPAPPPTQKSGSPVVTVHTKAGTLATGSATLSEAPGTNATGSEGQCRLSGLTKTEKYSDWSASYHSTGPLTFHFAVGGNLTVPNMAYPPGPNEYAYVDRLSHT
jgi:hypothetical protein